jgi:hypothetical protein
MKARLQISFDDNGKSVERRYCRRFLTCNDGFLYDVDGNGNDVFAVCYELKVLVMS